MVPVLEADVGLSKGTWRLRAALSAGPGQTVAIVGPNGSGKTSLLHALAGITPLTDGFVTYSEQRWDEPSRGLLIRPDRRDAAICFQDARLFPHLSVLDNVAFPARCAGLSKAQARERSHAWVERFGLSALAGRRPSELSGGQGRRVALARTLATQASLVLLDEPTASLDGQATVEVRELLREALSEHQGVAVIVSHDPRDALGLADQIVVLESGNVVNRGSATEIAARPGSAYVADLVGANLIAGVASDGRLVTESGAELAAPVHLKGPVFASIPTRAVRVLRRDSLGAAPAVAVARWLATVETVEHQWVDVRVGLRGPINLLADISLATFTERSLVEGDVVSVQFDEADVTVYSAVDGPRS